jgi:aminoglycoside phosphotransferase family enzyme/predicted kinase
MVVDEVAGQEAVFALLANPATYGRSERVQRIDTHAAVVFLAGPDAYKIKRAVRLPYLDFSTLAQRRSACEAELRVNRSNAPGLYLGVVPITAGSHGLELGGDGAPVEWAVHLRRFDETQTLDRLAEAGRLAAETIQRLGEAVAAAHRQAPPCNGAAALAAFRHALAQTLDELDAGLHVFPSALLTALRFKLERALGTAEPLLQARADAGAIRRCHGDLHLGNVVLIDGTPILFDAVEFDEALALIDVLYDLAFLIADLVGRGQIEAANALLNRYLWSCETPEREVAGLALLPMFLSLRAAICAKIAATRWRLGGDAKAADRARADLRNALGFLSASTPRLIAVGGLSGTGKSTLAAALAPSLPPVPGAVHLRNDVERKRLFGVADTVRLPAGAYSPAVTDLVDARMDALAAAALKAGSSVVIDATLRDPARRAAAAALARQEGASFAGLWLDAPREMRLRRVDGRRNDASDADHAVAAAQAEEAAPEGWHVLDARVEPAALAAAARAAIGLEQQEETQC